MKSTARNSHSPQPDDATHPPRPEVLVVFENVAAGEAAEQRLLDVLARDHGGTMLRLMLWRQDLQNAGEIYAQAVRDAATAKMVLIALRGDLALTPAAVQWLATWHSLNPEWEGVLGLMDDRSIRTADAANGTLAFLRRNAKMHRARRRADSVRGPVAISELALQRVRRSQSDGAPIGETAMPAFSAAQ